MREIAGKEGMTWILWWKYLDSSGIKLVRAYNNQEKAAKDLELVSDLQDGRNWQVEEVKDF